jgi:hypothetical protein
VLTRLKSVIILCGNHVVSGASREAAMDREREGWMSAMEQHEREIAELRVALDRIARTAAPQKPRHDALFLQAQMTKHRISIALLAARLAEAPLPTH